MKDNQVKGSCLCESVKFEITFPTKFAAHCHCSLCRRAHGAAYVTWVGVKNNQFKLTSGEQYLGKYKSTPEAIRTFCRNCGSPLFFESSRWEGEIHVAQAHLKGELDRAPRAHVFFDDHVPWVDIF